MPFTITDQGNFNNTEKFLQTMKDNTIFQILAKYAEMGMSALSSATPVDSGITAASWDYSIKVGKESAQIQWYNNHTNGEFNIAISLQYGHGTRNGGYVVGRDYINPAMRPIFDDIAEQVWASVVNA